VNKRFILHSSSVTWAPPGKTSNTGE